MQKAQIKYLRLEGHVSEASVRDALSPPQADALSDEPADAPQGVVQNDRGLALGGRPVVLARF